VHGAKRKEERAKGIKKSEDEKVRKLEDKRKQETEVTIHILASGFWPFDILTTLSHSASSSWPRGRVEGLLLIPNSL
jgi:hypothetical protein